ncbi:A24 family peptidase [Methylomarinum sp. Ch1-1]|uniref:Prepilin leader peptidase/N-methyltransferase n=1 Tax=Methylomarinum roseum TaxID=3067653 RepID=A0AAU7NXQ2_9GAMM|nr:A24 family peptidase [Methylomarinum sp. Ch1-1]MDP4522088.1 A24 family peptidase [Methylomarinum sp. Ch1-1]
MQLLLDTLQHSLTLLTAVIFVLGLMIGSFLNVVIFRLPVMMTRDWRRECREFLELEEEPQAERFNLLVPLSRCPHCQTDIKPYQNIPVFSYLFLQGKCAQCGSAISPRYPLIEAFTGICSAIVAWHFGYGAEMLFALLLTWCLIAASFIDIDHQLLPDSITLPMLWLGLFLSLFSVYTDPQSSIIGAIAGYLSLWTIYQLFKLLTGKEGMGYGDFKLLALFGAWLGWQYLPLIVLLSSLVGSVIGIAMVILVKKDRNTPIPFGPYLAAAGWLALIWGDEINRLYLNTIGL